MKNSTCLVNRTIIGLPTAAQSVAQLRASWMRPLRLPALQLAGRHRLLQPAGADGSLAW
jgi:hypothetical protein